MKVLVATHVGQGTHSGDYCHTLDGELVTPVVASCSAGDRCGCNRGFPGFASSKATTTAMVVDLAHIGEQELADALLDSLTRGGWIRHDMAPSRRDAILDMHLDAILQVCAEFPIGTVVGRHDHEVFARTRLAA